MQDHTPDQKPSHQDEIKFHYSREERLARGYANLNSSNNCLFCKGNRIFFIIVIDAMIILALGFFYYYFVGRTSVVKTDGFEFFLSKKDSVRDKIIDFTLEIKNISRKKNTLESAHYQFVIKDRNRQNVFERDLFITRLNYEPGQFHIEKIFIEDLPAGKYRAVININKDQEIKLNFKIKTRPGSS